jgi:hypothetical protein
VSCVLYKPQEWGGPGLRWAVARNKTIFIVKIRPCLFIGLRIWPCSQYGRKARRICFINNTGTAVGAVCSCRDRVTDVALQIRQIGRDFPLTQWLCYRRKCLEFLGAFVILRKETAVFVISVRQFAWKNSTPTGRIFMKIDTWIYFRKSLERIQVTVKPNDAIYDISRLIIFRMRNVWGKSCRQNQNTFCVFIFLKSCRLR